MKQIGAAMAIAAVVVLALANAWSIGSGLYRDLAFLRIARLQYDLQVAQRQAQLAGQATQPAVSATQTPATPPFPAAPAGPAKTR